MKAYLYLVLVFTGMVYRAAGQEKCATVQYNKQLEELEPGTSHEIIFEKWIRNKRVERISQPGILEIKEEEVYEIPVVVHVIHSGEPVGEGVNLSQEQILSQINVLNEDYRRLNFDTIYTPDLFRPVAVDTRIQFVLAERDPAGGLSNGINRVRGTQSSWNPNSLIDDRNLKALSFWPPEDYLNIWVTNLSGSYLGYAQYPETSLPGSLPPFDRETDGVVIDYSSFGSVNEGIFPEMRGNYDRGRTTTHEVGHFLGLRHVWGDGGCGATDYCADTPDQEHSYDSCNGIDGFSCGSDDMYQNYMDYTYDACMNIFSRDQKERMRIVLENSPRRESLLTSPGLLPPDNFPNTLVIREISAPENISCASAFTPEIIIQNTGINTITEFEIELLLDDQRFPLKKFETILLPGAQQVLDLTAISGEVSLAERQHFMQVSIIRPNGVEGVSYDNRVASRYFLTNSLQDVIPLREQAEVPGMEELDWGVYNPDNGDSWEILSTPFDGFENQAIGIEFYNYTSVGEADWLVSPVLDFSNSVTANMTFDFSYAQYDTIKDILKIRVSLDCGATFPFTVLEAGGEILANQQSDGYWKPTVANDWQKAYVELEDFAGEPAVRIAFMAVNGNGNNLYIDNIEFYTTGFTRDITLQEDAVLIHPNPSADGRFYVTVNTPEREPVQVRIINSQGRMIMEKEYENVLNQTFEYDLTPYRNGIYIIRMSGRTFNKSTRIMINK